MRNVWSSFKIAWSMYSRIPIRDDEWTRKSMRYVMCFFPMIGIVIGALEAGAFYLASLAGIGEGAVPPVLLAAVMALIPFWISGGIHLDGFMDTADALGSHKEREEKLRILKDPHAGSFAVMHCAAYFLLYAALLSGVSEDNIWQISLTFVLSRALSALAIVLFPKAKNTGLAALFADRAQKVTVAVCSSVYILAALVDGMILSPARGLGMLIAAALMFLFYYAMSKRQFGGITGDLAGWFLIVCEVACTAGIILAGWLI